MSRKFLFVTILILTVLITSASDCLAYRQRGKKTDSKPAKIFNTKFSLVPNLTGGFVLGGASEAINKLEGDEWKYKILYGAGVSLEYYYRPQYALCLNLEVLWKNLPGEDYGSIRFFTYSAAWMYRFTPAKSYSFYFRPELGLLTGKAPDFNDLELGTYYFCRLGLGVFRYTSGWTNTRMEIYYKMILSSGHEINRFGVSEIDFDAEALCLEIGFGIPL